MESKWAKYFATGAIFYGSAVLGVMNGFFGPSLIEFKDALSTDIATINVVSTTCQAFLLISIFCFSIVCKYVQRETLSPIILALLGTATTLLPYSGNLITFALLMTLISIARGGFVAVQLVWIIDIWKESSGPFLQAQHFFQAVGIIFPPIIFAPYLSQGIGTISILPLNLTSLTPSLWNGTAPSGLSLNESQVAGVEDAPQNYDYLKKTPNLHIPSAICGSIAFIGAFVYIILYFVLRKKTLAPLRDLMVCESTGDSINSSVTTEPSSSDQEEQQRRGKKRRIILMLFSILIYGSFISSEYTNVDFMTQFLHYSQLKVSTEEGAQILLFSVVAYVCFTFFGILLNLKIPSQFIIWGNVLFIIGGVAVLWVAASVVQLELVRIAGILIGIGLSTGEPSIYHYVNEHLKLTTVSGAVLTVSSGILVISYRYILGALIEIEPFVYLYVNVINIACVILGMLGILLWA